MRELIYTCYCTAARKQSLSRKDTHILVSTLQESYLFRFDGSSRITRVSPSSTAIITNQPTLALANIPRRLQKRAGPGQNSVSEYVNSSLVVQITSTGVTLLEYDMALGQHTKVGDGWVPNAAQKGTGWQGRHIIVAAINPSQIVLGISGARLVLLNLTDKDEFNQLMCVFGSRWCSESELYSTGIAMWVMPPLERSLLSRVHHLILRRNSPNALLSHSGDLIESKYFH